MSQNAMIRLANVANESTTHAFLPSDPLGFASKVPKYLLNTSWTQAFSIASRIVTLLTKEFFPLC